MNKLFQMTNPGLEEIIPDFDVIAEQDQICLNQATYANKIYETFKMDECNPS